MADDTIQIHVKANDEASGPIKEVNLGIGNIIKTAGGIAGGLVAFDSIKEGISSLIDAGKEYQTVQAQTNAVITSTKGAAGESADAIGELADSMSRVAPFQATTIQQGENMLLTFTNIGKSVFPQATQSVTDMTAAMQAAGKNMNISDVAIMVGKALNNPVKGMTALQRVGVSFTADQKLAVKQMQATGDVAGAQSIILGELQKEFGGSAKAAGQTFAGQLQILKNQLQVAEEHIGVKLLGALTAVASIAIPLAIRGIDLFQQVIEALIDIISGPISTAFAFMKGVISTAVDIIVDKATHLWGILRGPLLNAFQTVSSFLSGTLWPILQQVGSYVGTVLSDAFGFVRDHLMQFLGVIDPGLAIIIQFAKAVGKDGLGGALHDLPGIILNVVTSAEQLLGEIGGKILNALESVDWGKVGQYLLAGLTTALGVLKNIGSGVIDLEHQFVTWVQSVDWAGIGRTIITDVTTAISTAVTAATGVGQTIYSWISTQVTAINWSGVASTIMGGISTAFSSAKGAVAGAATSGPLSGLLGSITDAVGKVKPLVDAFVAALRPIWTNLQQSLAPTLAQMQPLWQSLVQLFHQIVAAITPMAPLLQIVKPLLEAVGIVVGTVLVAAIGLALGGLGGFVGFLTGVMPGAIQTVTGIIEVFTGVIQTISAIVTGVVSIVVDLIHGDWQGAWNDAQTMVKGVADGIGTIIQGLKDTVTGIIKGMIGGVTGLIQGFVSSIIGFFQNLYDSLVGHSIIPDMVNSIIDWIGQLPGRAASKIADFVSGITGQITDLATGMVTQGAAIVTNLVQGIASEELSVLNMAAQIIGDITGAFADAGSWLFKAGVAVIQGLIDGIKSMVSGVTGVLDDITSKIPIHKGPLERDYQLLQPAGHAIMGGLIDSIASDIPALMSLLSTIGMIAVTATTGGLGGQLAAGPGIANTLQQRIAASMLPPDLRGLSDSDIQAIANGTYTGSAINPIKAAALQGDAQSITNYGSIVGANRATRQQQHQNTHPSGSAINLILDGEILWTSLNKHNEANTTRHISWTGNS